MSQAGIVLVLKDEGSSKWSKISFGFNYQANNNFGSNVFARGNNSKYNGIDKYFLYHAMNRNLDDISQINGEFSKLIKKRVIYTMISILGLIGMVERVSKYLQISPNYLDMDSRTGFISGSCVALNEKLLTQSAIFEWIYVVGVILLISTFFGEIKILSSSKDNKSEL